MTHHLDNFGCGWMIWLPNTEGGGCIDGDGQGNGNGNGTNNGVSYGLMGGGDCMNDGHGGWNQ